MQLRRESKPSRASFGAMREAETTLERQVASQHGSPFIAHYDLTPSTREAALDELVARLHGSLNELPRLAQVYPCVLAWAVATSIAADYGRAGDANVYRPIARRLGVGDTVASKDRHELNAVFRKACRRHGLALPPRSPQSRMVDDYLFQAGVAHEQLAPLAKAFRRGEKAFGAPASDDTAEIDSWEDRAVEFAPPGLSVLRRIIRDDSTGFHATSYLQLKSQECGTSRFESAFIKAIANSRSPSSDDSAAVQPHLEYGDGELRIGIPKGAGSLELRVTGRAHRLSPGQSLPLPVPWPPSIEWKPRSSGWGGDWNSMAVFSGPDVILVFEPDTGLRKGELSPSGSSKQVVPGGQICLLARKIFNVGPEQAYALGPEAFVLWHEATRDFSIDSNGDQIDVAVDVRPRLQLTGARIARSNNVWLLAAPINYDIAGDCSSLGEDLEIRVEHPAQARTHVQTVPVAGLGGMGKRLELPDKGDFGMARISLHVRGQERALYRSRFWHWPGLRGFVDHCWFDASAIPNNLSEANLSHIARNAAGQFALSTDEAYLHARLSFSVRGRIVRFELPPPGESISVRGSDGTERAIKQGSSLIVSKDYASSLIVRCRDTQAAINCKGTVIPLAFGKVGTWRESFAVLNEVGTDNRVRLILDGSGGVERDLVRIVSEAEPTRFNVRRIGRLQAIDAHFDRPIEEVRIESENLFTGEQFQEDCCTSILRHDERSSRRLEALRLSEDLRSVRIKVDGNNFLDGLWFVSLAIREAGRTDWMPMIDAYGHSYAVSVAPESTLAELSTESEGNWPREVVVDSFLRLCRVTSIPISWDCREAVHNTVKRAWRFFGELLAGEDSSSKADMLKACVVTPPPTAPETWVPVRHPIEVDPDLFTGSAEAIGHLASSDLEGYEGFEAVEAAGCIGSLPETAEVLGVSTAFLMGFEHAAKSGADPRADPGAFVFKEFMSRLKQFDDEGLLSQWHYRRSCERLADRCATIAPEGPEGPLSNRTRIGMANRVASSFDRNGRDYLRPPSDIVEECHLVDGAARLISALARDSRSGRTDEFWKAVSVDTGIADHRTRKHVGFILRLAPELLSFYLLLWEIVERVRKS